MAIFNSFLYVYRRVTVFLTIPSHGWFIVLPCFAHIIAMDTKKSCMVLRCTKYEAPQVHTLTPISWDFDPIS